jgi:hydroxymethylbilane synthase
MIIGTRGSELALWQTGHVADLLRKKFSGLDVEVKIIKTTGDKILDSPLSKIGDKGLFTKELDKALLEKKTDIAVHSLKDIPTEIPEDLTLAAILERQDPRDVFIPNPSFPEMKLKDIPIGGKVATGSLRRRSQLLNLRPDLEIVEIRGNLDSRIKKLRNSDWCGMILAYAGVARLGWNEIIGEIIPVSVILPAVGQGAIGVISRKNDQSVLSHLISLDDGPTRLATLAERSLLRRLQGGCQVPVGAYGFLSGDILTLQAMVGDPSGTTVIRDSATGTPGDYDRIGIQLADRLISKGADKILNRIRKQPER